MYFESHAHYDDSRFDFDRDELLSTVLKQNGVEYIINVGADMPSSRKSIELAERYSQIYAAVGVHPHEAQSMKDTDFRFLEEWSSHRKVVAIGEIGLDYYYDHSPREVQTTRFQEQLELAKRVDLPVIIHSRDADQQTFDMIKTSGIHSGVIHCYSGSAEMAVEYVKIGFFIGVGGMLTYKNAKNLPRTVEKVPISHILIETDSPYLSPVPHRGKRNDSQNLKYICEKIAQIKQITVETVENLTKENAFSLFCVE